MRFTVLILALLATPLQAGPLRNQYFGNPDLPSNNCYVRAYTGAHLAKHPAQMVTGISLQISALSPEGQNPLMDLFVSLRGDGTLYHTTAECQQTEFGLSCAVEGGGKFLLTGAKKGVLRLTMQSEYLRFAHGRIEIDMGLDDRVFLIPNVAADNCG